MASYAGSVTPLHRPAVNALNRVKQNFDYSLRVSRRARHVRLTVKPFVGLEVTIPKRFPQHQIGRILQQHEDWITTQLDKHAGTFAPLSLPDQIRLQLIDRSVDITYQTSSAPGLELRSDRLTVFSQDQDQALQLLRDWIRQQARQLLIPRLHAVADELGFSCRRVIIRSQKSRWGSCSSRGTISLNDQLLFVPADSVRYLMIHELCHTRHMNHSPAFWNLVQRYCADHKKHEQVLNHGHAYVPDWFLQSLYS